MNQRQLLDQKMDDQNGASRVRVQEEESSMYNEELLAKEEYLYVNFRVLAFAGGISVISTSILSIILCLIQLRPIALLVYIYTLSFGIVICILETPRGFWNTSSTSSTSDESDCSEQLRQPVPLLLRFETINTIRQQSNEALPILKYLWGRGALYVFFGTFQMTLLSPMNIAVGVFLIGVGTLYIIIGIGTRRRMRKLRTSLRNEKSIQRYFKRFDENRDGMLDENEFASFVAHLTGSAMDEDELEGTFEAMDKSRKGYVTLDELKKWWEGFKDEDQKEETGGYVSMF